MGTQAASAALQHRIMQLPDQENRFMSNPWTKKNPLLSLWLSGANAVIGKARGHSAAAMKRQQTALTRQAGRFWTDSWLAALTPKRRR